MRRMKRLKYLFLLVFATVLVGCVNSGGKKSDENGTKQLRIGVMSSMDYLPLAVAKENGFFEDEAVNVAINKFYSANERDAAFQSRNLDGTILDYTGAAIQYGGGVDIKLTSQCDGTFVLVASEESGVDNVEDLNGKSIAVSRNTVIDFCTDLVLQEANMSEDDADKIEINKIPLRLEMLRSGKIDATMLPDPFATIALAGNNKNVIDIVDMDLRVTGLAFHDEAIAQKSEAIKSFYRAYNQAIALINSQPVDAFHELLIKEIGVPAELVDNIQLPNYSPAQLPQERDLQKVEQWLKSKDLVTKDFTIYDLVAEDLIP